MPLSLAQVAPSLLIRNTAFERVGLNRTLFDDAFNLTEDEFRVEGSLIIVGPIFGEETIIDIVAHLEDAGLVYFDDFFEMSGNWPEWLELFAMGVESPTPTPFPTPHLHPPTDGGASISDVRE